MTNSVVIIHGWSDQSKSFHRISEFLKTDKRSVLDVWLADYISMEDDISVEDVAKRMHGVLLRKLGQQSFDMIVHSTGGLVARQWVLTYGEATDGPRLKRLIMLAPANFGSKLATMGQSMIGRILAGWKDWCHTGKTMLDNLELASLYQWQLADQDLFQSPDLNVGQNAGNQNTGNQNPQKMYYGPDAIWLFVIVGSHPYDDALKQIINEHGSDGTVRVPAANMNIKGATLDFSQDEAHPSYKEWPLRHQDFKFPFAVLPDKNHWTITFPESETPFGDLIMEALSCQDTETYRAMSDRWEAVSEKTAEDAPTQPYHQQFMILNVHVVDDHGNDVPDFFLEFYGSENDEPKDAETVFFHQEVLRDTHVNQYNASYRCLYLNRYQLLNGFYARVTQGPKILNASISVRPPGKNIQYFSDIQKGAAGHFTMHRQDPNTVEGRWLRRNTTHFLKIIIPRNPKEQVFNLSAFQSERSVFKRVMRIFRS